MIFSGEGWPDHDPGMEPLTTSPWLALLCLMASAAVSFALGYALVRLIY